MNASAPVVSIVVPVHNEEDYLAATLESAIAQDHADEIEIIAALNGCEDGSRAVAEQYPVRIVESDECGMSFGKNLGAASATAPLLLFLDADTVIPTDLVGRFLDALGDRERTVVTCGARPERGGGVVRACFRIGNWYARRNHVLSIAPVFMMQRELFDDIGGLDENLPQGTSSDCIMRALDAGAEYVWTPGVYAVTSIRRFEKRGIVPQLLSWRKNHRLLREGRRDRVAEREYETVR